MTTTIEVYEGFQLTAIEQPDGRWMTEIVLVGGRGKPFVTQPFGEKNDAMASARRIVDNGIRG